MESGSQKPFNIFFLTLHPFPFGLAQTNRLIAMAGGLVKAGCRVKVICLKPTEHNVLSKNTATAGNFNGIEYIYPSATTFRASDSFTRIVHFISGIYRTTLLLISENRKHRIDFIFAGVLGFFISFWFYLISRILKIKYLQERSEFPFIRAGKSGFDDISLYLYLTITCKFFDGFLVITRNLREYFTPHLRKNCPVFHLPILVEPERFSHISLSPAEKYIAYCGSMQGNKDGVPDLIDAFGLISGKFPEINLCLIGGTEFEGFDRLQEKIARLSLTKRVIFTSVMDRENLPDMLGNAIMLVLARPESKQAEGGFPTKLGEYLATGKPVVVTGVGEIGDYLHDGENAYIAKPGDPRHFAEKMESVLNDYENALRIGARGQKLALTTFNYIFQGKELAAWLQNIAKTNG
ncbi:MAG TPA: glycosyltransferase family 4 protein [Bacteroidales bacterium]|nr:glycosyltransferase family 4 protein [Bacteroidales bacterium]